jgi:tRNA(fMet)-specific endonuclease VapC
VRIVRTLLTERRMRLTAITGFGLRVGTDFLDRRELIMRMFRSRTLPLDLRSALLAGGVASEFKARGESIGFADCLQAGICLRHDVPLPTRNRQHVSRVDGLVLVDLDQK